MGIKCAEDPFNMGMFFDIRRPSLWVHFQTPNTHIRPFHTGVAPGENIAIVLIAKMLNICHVILQITDNDDFCKSIKVVE